MYNHIPVFQSLVENQDDFAFETADTNQLPWQQLDPDQVLHT